MTATVRTVDTIEFEQVSSIVFGMELLVARANSRNVKAATTHPSDLPWTGVRYFFSAERECGYGVTDTGELIGVFSLHRGQGDAIMADAITNGANRLDCFDGYLVEFYSRHGFEEVGREANWTDGAPDVVYMALCQCEAPSAKAYVHARRCPVTVVRHNCL